MITAANVAFALSIKQPWAALVIAGVKTIEIRRWPTARRGRILIHAAGVADERPEAWNHVPENLRALTEYKGGIIGAVILEECRSYRDLTEFVSDQAKHFNEASWFKPPLLYGFRFVDPEILPFQKFPGWFRFFKVPGAAPNCMSRK